MTSATVPSRGVVLGRERDTAGSRTIKVYEYVFAEKYMIINVKIRVVETEV